MQLELILSTAAAAANSLRSCRTLCDPIDGSPPGSPIPGILQARTLKRADISFSNAWKWKVKVKSLSCVWLLATLWTVDYQAPPSMGFSRQEYWSGVPLPSPILSTCSAKMKNLIWGKLIKSVLLGLLSLVAQMVRICLQCGRPGFNPGVGKIPWRWEWLHTLVFLPGEFHGQRSLEGYSLWGLKESDLTEQLTLSLSVLL